MLVSLIMWILRRMGLTDGALALVNRLDRKAISLDNAWMLEPGSYDEDSFAGFRDSLEAVSIGRGFKAPGIVVVDVSAPLAYLAGPYNDPVFNIAYELLEADFTMAEKESIVAVLLAKTFVHPDLGVRVQARDLEVDPAVLNEIRGAYPNAFGGLNQEGLPFLSVIIADTLAVRETLDPGALETAIIKCVNMITARKVRVRGLEHNRWCALFVCPELAGDSWNRPLSWLPSNFSSWRDLIDLRVDNLQRIKAGRRRPGQGTIDL